MFTLYYRPTCPFCRRVINEANELGIELNKKDIEEEEIAKELIALGGKLQVPYLMDESANKGMYETDTIIAYLKEKSA